jgi:hypothetical protein
MAGARSLIAEFNELNKSSNKTVSHFTPSLIGMFGSTGIFDSFLVEVDSAIASGNVPASLKKRAANLIGTFIPQVAEYNSIKNLSSINVSANDLKSVAADSLENRRKGIEIILAALIAILREVEATG